MTTKDEELRKLTEERDSLKLEIENLRTDLAGMEIRANCPPPEAGFSTNFHLAHDKAGVQQFTFRGRTSGDWRTTMEDVGNFCAFMFEKGWRFNAPQPAPPPAPNKAATIARETGNDELAQAIESNGAEVPSPPAGKTWLTLDASRVVILPKPDERIAVEFYASGHKYPDLKTTWKAEQVAGLLKHVTSADVTKAADLALACRVYYTLGKEYTNAQTGAKGNYKDIGHVRPLSA